MMKKISIYLLLFSLLLISCDNHLPDELFEKHVLINQNGFLDYELNYVNNSQVDTMISVAVSGSSKLDRNVVLQIEVNPDTLKDYNWEKYRNDTLLYYSLLPDSCYCFDGSDIMIQAGTDFTDVPIRFYLDKIDKDKDYILPLSIVSTSGYIVGRGYNTVLMHIVLSNLWSGTYSLSGILKEDGFDETMDIKMTRHLRIVDDKTCYFYAGNIAENNSQRDSYRIEMTMNADSTLTFSSPNHSLKVVGDTPDLNPKNPVNKVVVEESQDVLNSHKKYVITTFYVNYHYRDLSNPENSGEIYFKGTMARTKIIYTK